MTKKATDRVVWPRSLESKINSLTDWLTERKGVLVAWSGGVDSTFLAVMAHRVLGQATLAVTADSPSFPRDDLRATKALAKQFGLRHKVIATAEMANPVFTANPPDRCYHCKSELFGTLRRLADQAGLADVADGSNADDTGDFRPGTRAAQEHGVKRPLQELGFTKEEIRAASRVLGLPTADKPATACLTSRIPYGTPITPENLAVVEKSERVLQKLGFVKCRVRLHGDVGRIELPPEELGQALAKREAILEGLKKAGVRYITLDLQGYRTGSLNELLKRG
jgi:uncharacterized protein